MLAVSGIPARSVDRVQTLLASRLPFKPITTTTLTTRLYRTFRFPLLSASARLLAADEVHTDVEVYRVWYYRPSLNDTGLFCASAINSDLLGSTLFTAAEQCCWTSPDLCACT